MDSGRALSRPLSVPCPAPTGPRTLGRGLLDAPEAVGTQAVTGPPPNFPSHVPRSTPPTAPPPVPRPRPTGKVDESAEGAVEADRGRGPPGVGRSHPCSPHRSQMCVTDRRCQPDRDGAAPGVGSLGAGWGWGGRTSAATAGGGRCSGQRPPPGPSARTPRGAAHLRGAARPAAPTYRRRRGDPRRASAPPPPLQHGRPLRAGSALALPLPGPGPPL